MSSKSYKLNLDVYKANAAIVAKMPKQQQQILATMAEHCVETGMRGSDIVDLAKKAGLETRQKSTVLYAWYARSNETVGVYMETVPVTVAPVPTKSADKADTKSKTK